MKTKKIILSLAVVAAIAILSVSCDKRESPLKPSVILTEVGHENSKTAMRGDDLHLEAEIVAEGLVSRIDVEIHQENGKYEIGQSYTSGKYIGVKNTEFHEHVEIPVDAPLGEYHLHFTVADQTGQTTVSEAYIEIIEYDEDHHHDE